MYKIIDLFCGIGGIRLGFEPHGVTCVMSSEIDKKAAEVYEQNFGEKPLGDITKIEVADIPDFDILVGGFPCQPFSIGGLRKGFEDTRGTLFFEVAKIIQEKKPKAFLLENVAGLVSHDKGKTLEVIETTLRSLGYAFAWKLMNASDYGIPQNRNRWYGIGFREDLAVSFEEPSIHSPEHVFRFPSTRPLLTTVKDIVKDIDSTDFQVSELAQKHIRHYLKAYQQNPKYHLHPDEILLAHEVRASRCGFRKDGIAPCLTAKMGTGGNNVPIYVNQMRKLTVHECKLLNGFPVDFQLPENTSQSYKQLGNSVVVPVIHDLAKEMIRLLTLSANTDNSTI